jgi:hypothetical protein
MVTVLVMDVFTMNQNGQIAEKGEVDKREERKHL